MIIIMLCADSPDSFSPLVSIAHRFGLVFLITSYAHTVLVQISSSWTSNICSSVRRNPEKYVAYGFSLSVSVSLSVCLSLSIYIYEISRSLTYLGLNIRLVCWLIGCGLQQIIPCMLFNDKCCLYIHIRCIRFLKESFVGNNLYIYMLLEGNHQFYICSNSLIYSLAYYIYIYIYVCVCVSVCLCEYVMTVMCHIQTYIQILQLQTSPYRFF